MSLVLSKTFTWWGPELISTALWLDANDSSTVIQSGGAVTTWNDKSGNNHHATANGNPTYSATGMSTSKPAVQLDGTGDYLTSSINGLQNFTAVDVYMVLQTTVAASADTNTATFWSFGANSNKQLIWFSSTGLLPGETIAFLHESSANDITGRRLGSNLYTRSANVAQIFNTKNSTSGTSLLSNGSEILLNLGSIITTSTNTSPASTTFTANNTFYIGAQDISQSPAIKFAEIIVSSTLLSTITRQKLEGYLAHKWGLAANLPSDHPYKTSKPAP